MCVREWGEASERVCRLCEGVCVNGCMKGWWADSASELLRACSGYRGQHVWGQAPAACAGYVCYHRCEAKHCHVPVCRVVGRAKGMPDPNYLQLPVSFAVARAPHEDRYDLGHDQWRGPIR